MTVLLETRGLTRHFKVGGTLSRKRLHAVDDVNLSIGSREIIYQGRALSTIRRRKELLAYRSDVPMVFQDPFSSLNPAYRVKHGIMRGLLLHRPDLSAAQRRDEALRVVEAVGLNPAAEILDRFPYELSGGQRQRIGFAQALAYRPKLILADEPVSMLDVSIRIGLLNVMAGLRENEGVSILYITHDIASARYVSDRIAVMYGGHVVETGPTEAVLSNAKHPYTQLLLSAVPDPRAPLDPDAVKDRGEPPRVVDPKPGCRFQARCPLAIDRCSVETPLLRDLGPEHQAACHVAVADAPTPVTAAP